MENSKNISWNEIKKHTSVEDRWIVINNKVYNVTNWQHRHPGGRKIIGHYAGQDATEAFKAFHKHSEAVEKYVKPFYVGDVDLNSERCYNDFLSDGNRQAFIKDFEALRIKMHKMGFFKPNLGFFTMMFVQVVICEMLAYLNLLYFGVRWFTVLLSVALYTVAQSQASWLQHDLGHLSVFESTKMNHLFHEIVLGFIKGTSCHWWNYMHSQHHAKPNVIDKDPDIRLEPVFVVGETLPVRAASKESPWIKHFPYQYQNIYFFLIGPPLLFPVYFQYTSFRYVFTRRRWEDLAWIIAWFIKLFGLYYPILGFWGTLGYFLLVRTCESHWFTWVSQSNHIPMEVSYDREEPWLPMQNRATCNVEHSRFNDWFTGHLNFQLEHHLFPTMPRHNLIKAQPFVKELCARHNLSYPIKPMGIAFVDVVRALRKSAQIWKKAVEAQQKSD